LQQAVLALEDGTVFEGVSFGAPVQRTGEVVFNTAITGYQEIFTDPSYCGQIVVLTNPQIGNYGANPSDSESTKPFIEGLVVREAQPEKRLWVAHHGVIEARLAAIRHPDTMVAFWPIGFEARPDDCGELCIAEIFGSEIDDDGGWVGVGVKPQNDPRLREDFEKVRVDGDLTDFHDFAVDGCRSACGSSSTGAG